ncbi:MAG: type II toxin-antitoxin system Phd/YefM family antitoxin [Acidobacteriota bacterium]|nr:type II toxin-antitoxin system Phd/YefM family antitoxin [Acidobacteriota bacterium]
MPRTLTATSARVRFGELLRDVADRGETVFVERNGKPQAVVMPLAEYRRLRRLEESGGSWEALLDETIAEIDRDLEGRTLPPADEVIRAMREDRDADLGGLR